MRAGGRDLQAVLRSQFRQLSAKIDNLLPGITRVAANVGIQFYDRLVQLRFDAFLQDHSAIGKELLDVRTQFACLRIYDLEFLFNAQSENVVLSGHASQFPRSLRQVSTHFRATILRFCRACPLITKNPASPPPEVTLPTGEFDTRTIAPQTFPENRKGIVATNIS